MKGRNFESQTPKGAHLEGAFCLGALQRCELMRNGLGPIPGHCRWCDQRIAESKQS